jgi:uncharacterized membrane-anchored protein YhcB (DUF1043 family)
MEILLGVGGLVVGAVVGALIYRNNAKMFEEKYQKALADLEALKNKYGVPK